MKLSTKILAVLPILLQLTGSAYKAFDNSLNEQFILISYVVWWVFLIHLISDNKKNDWLYSVALVLALIGSIGIIFKIMHWPFAGPMLLLAEIGVLVLIGLLLSGSVIKSWLYSFALALLFITSIGTIFKIMHWPFSGPMMFAGILDLLLLIGFFLYNSISSKKEIIRYEQFFIVLCMLSQFLLIVYIHEHQEIKLYAKLLYYPIAALCASILFKHSYANRGERSVILYVVVHSVILIINQIL